MTPNEWFEIDRRVQEVLGEIWDRVGVQKKAAGFSKWHPNGWPTKLFPLRSYYVFYRRSFDEHDPLYVGISFKKTDGGFLISCDVGGEESGSVIHRECVETADDFAEAFAVVEQLLAGLIKHEHQIIKEALETTP